MQRSPSPVLAQIIGKAGVLTLNRPKALHALNVAMCEALTRQLLEWINDSRVALIVLNHAPGTRGFCAGGDVKMLAESGSRCDDRGETFFKTEYRLNELISRYPKPIVTVMDGITMGGGVGLSIHAQYQVATQNTVLAMPETGIGLFPDIGSTWFLPRLQGELGTWLALTGARLTGADVLTAGMATHFCDARQLQQLYTNLSTDGPSALDKLDTAADFEAHRYAEDIQYLFSGECLEEICKRLNAGDAWAREQATRVFAKSPLSSKVALRQIRTGRFLCSLRDALRLEYRIAIRMIRTRNFREGVRAALIDMDHCPKWCPASVYATTYDDVSKFFTPLEDNELTFLEEF